MTSPDLAAVERNLRTHLDRNTDPGHLFQLDQRELALLLDAANAHPGLLAENARLRAMVEEACAMAVSAAYDMVAREVAGGIETEVDAIRAALRCLPAR